MIFLLIAKIPNMTEWKNPWKSLWSRHNCYFCYDLDYIESCKHKESFETFQGKIFMIDPLQALDDSYVGNKVDSKEDDRWDFFDVNMVRKPSWNFFFAEQIKQNMFHIFQLKHVVTMMVIFLTSIKLCFVQFSNFW